MALAVGLNDFEAGKSNTQAIVRVGPWISRIFWAQMALATLVAISVSIFMAQTLQWSL